MNTSNFSSGQTDRSAKSWRSLMTQQQIDERIGALNKSKNLPRDLVRKIKRSRELPMSHADRAKKFGTARHVVKRILLGTSYTDVLSDSEEDEANVIIGESIKNDKVFKDALERVKRRTTDFKDDSGVTHALWDGNKSQKGNPHLVIYYFGIAQAVTAVVYMASNKLTEIPEGLIMCHKCKFKYCVALNCVAPDTHLQNAKDKIRDGT